MKARADAGIPADVEDYYTQAARAATDGNASCCGPTDTVAFGAARYADVTAEDVPSAALLASLGCGNPTAVAELRPGERVLDLGSGAGTDVILSARRVGPTGRVYGLDAIDEMLQLARRNVAEARVENVELLRGTIESVPLPGDTVDVVISNCVVNLSADKPAVFAEAMRVLTPGGRLGISDVVADDDLTPADRAARGSRAECIAGALSLSEYEDLLQEAGFTDVDITYTHDVADGLHGAIVRAAKPALSRPALAADAADAPDAPDAPESPESPESTSCC
jgi:arsenite methyltransferase